MPIAGAGNPVTVPLDSGQQITRTVASLFPNLGSGLMTGSIKIDVKPGRYGPFIMSPGLMGSVRFAGADGSASAAVPLIMSPTRDCVYSHVAQGAGYYTGVAIQNTNETATGYTIDVYNKDGGLVGSYSSTLAPQARISKLVSQLVPASAGQVNGYFRIRGDAPLVSFALFGTNDVRSSSVITPQILQ